MASADLLTSVYQMVAVDRFHGASSPAYLLFGDNMIEPRKNDTCGLLEFNAG
jgi:hypothetical protein